MLLSNRLGDSDFSLDHPASVSCKRGSGYIKGVESKDFGGRDKVTKISTVGIIRVFTLILLSQEHSGAGGLVGWTLDSNPGSATLDKTLSCVALGLVEMDSSLF